jgi:hypothetical protein
MTANHARAETLAPQALSIKVVTRARCSYERAMPRLQPAAQLLRPRPQAERQADVQVHLPGDGRTGDACAAEERNHGEPAAARRGDDQEGAATGLMVKTQKTTKAQSRVSARI